MTCVESPLHLEPAESDKSTGLIFSFLHYPTTEAVMFIFNFYGQMQNYKF